MEIQAAGRTTRPLAYYQEDTDLSIEAIFTQPIKVVSPYPPPPYGDAINEGAFEWSDLARLNALIAHCNMRLFVQNGPLWQKVDMVHQGETLLRVSVEQLVGPAKLIEIMPRLVMYLGDASVDTCSRVNALLQYSKNVHLFADLGSMGNIRIQAIRPCGPLWLELVVIEADDAVHVLRRYYEPLLLML